jgi:hypothetical protein
MSRTGDSAHDGGVLRNALLGVLASAIWVTNYVIYFARDIRAAWRRYQERPVAPRKHGNIGPLAANERRAFPPPPPPPRPVREAEVVPGPKPRRSRPGR